VSSNTYKLFSFNVYELIVISYRVQVTSADWSLSLQSDTSYYMSLRRSAQLTQRNDTRRSYCCLLCHQCCWRGGYCFSCIWRCVSDCQSVYL